ncbi:TRAP transporter substrate-binding protein DctP [Paracoccus sp. SCSIO 75233]|uniref:TRAP transporter substrate-binding protein DctP n=1 Tax=Paracoccus sp. SCSIO 75233 TaxID=3017782 RepID=UPI0022F0CFE3|nr:TRAP transporter substrate-binding protein DctP [Paracoccus sp. SCSIO 75233]WBU53035.1 TRAP transporter substrate-binding protein DctP [Paracoccus sp. SCSIO 75233]
MPVAVQASDEAVTFRMVSTSGDASSPQGMSIQMWADRMSELSDGRMTGETFFQGELGGQQEVFDQMVRGNIDMVLELPQSSYDERVGVMSLPYLITDWDQAKTAYSPDGWMQQIVEPILEEVGVKFFGVYPDGFGGIATKGSYATNYEDAQALNLKVRAIPTFPNPQTLKAMGYQAVPIDWNEVYTSIQTGVVAGDAGNIIYWDYEYFGDQLDYYVHTRHNFSYSSLMMSLDSWNALDEEDQNIVASAAREVIDQRYESAQAFDAEWIQAAQDGGMEYIQPTDEELAGWAKIVHEQVWPEAEETFGSEIMDVVRSNVQVGG